MQYANFAYTCRKFSSNSYYDYQTEYREETYRNQFPQFECRIARGVREKYPLGFTDAMMRVDKPNGDFFYAVPFDTDEVAYLVKIDVKIDNGATEEDDKDYYDDEIKGADELQGAGDDDGDSVEQSDDDVDI